MNKFLNFCFTFGKWFVSVVLILLLIAGICIGGYAISTTLESHSYKIDYEFTATESTQQQTTERINVMNAAKKNHINVYKESIKRSFQGYNGGELTNKFSDKIAEFVETKVDEEDIDDFISKFPPYYNGAKTFMFDTLKKERKLSDKQAVQEYKIISDKLDDVILRNYELQYIEQNRARAAQRAQSKAALSQALMALWVTLCMFIIFLIIPILIRIEENTRRIKENTYEIEENTRKGC